MLQNTYTLPDLVELALKVPEVGAVNFNVLYTVLQTMITELRLTDLRPWCHIGNPMVAKAALTRAKLKGDVHKAHSESSIATTKLADRTSLGKYASSEARIAEPRHQQQSSLAPIAEEEIEDSEEMARDEESSEKPSQTEAREDSKSIEREEESSEKPFPIEIQDDSGGMETDDKSSEIPSSSKNQASQTDFVAQEQTPLHYHRSSQTSAEITEQRDVGQEDSEESEMVVEEPSTAEPSKYPDESEEAASPPPERPKPKPRREAAGWDDIGNEIKAHRDSIDAESTDKSKKKDLRQVRGAWQYTHLESRIEATEEGLMRLTDIVDMIVDKINKAEARRKPGGPASAELEALEDRIIDLEEGKEVWDYDHEVLVKLEENFNQMQKEFENIKTLGEDMEQMKADILKKADKKETEEALSEKASITLVNTKVDQVEFETAFEELGEAIGLLGIKFQNKNEEWEERAAELWDAVNSKMTRDIFEAARIKIEERLVALMYGLKTLKKVVEDLLYPDSGGVTRCIACRRPADISGHKCINLSLSPKRPYKTTSDDSLPDGNENLREALDQNKKLKSDGPPYGESKDTSLRVPYRSSTYNSSTDESDIKDRMKMNLAPFDKTSKGRKKQSEVFKSKKKSQRELVFTKGSRKTNEKEHSVTLEPSSSSLTLEPSSVFKAPSSDTFHIDLRDDVLSNFRNFPPLKMNEDPLRKGVLSPVTLNTENKRMSLSPLQSDISSKSTTSSSS